MTDTPLQPVQDLPAKAYEPTEREKAVVEAYAARSAESSIPRMLFQAADGTCDLRFDHPDQSTAGKLLVEALGASTVTAAYATVKDLVNITAKKGNIPSEHDANEALAIIKGIGPRDHVEMLLATQMVAIHRATIDMTGKLNRSTAIQNIESAERALNRLTRTFAAQVETLKRYRSKGEQTVEVKHVHVHEGGQAIVGNVQQGGGAMKNRDATA